jgi:aspartate/methionine/tyrosine aminotransferase
MTIREIGAGPGPRLLPSAADTAEAVSPRSIVYVNIFNNPTGECLDADELERLVGVAAENDSVVLVDIVSASLLHDDERACDNLRLLARAVGARRPVLVVGGLAKERGLPGIRGGWLIGPRDDIREIAPLNELIAPSSPTMTAPVVAVDALVRGVEWRVRREAEPGKALAEVAESVAAEVVARLPPHARASPVGALLARLAATPDAVRELAAGVIAWHRRVSATLDSNWAELQRDHADTLQSGGTWLGDFNAFVRVPLLDGLDAVDTTHRLFRERGVQILPGPVFGTDVRLWGPPDAFWTRLSFALPPEDWRRGLGLFLDWADSAARRASARRACG